MFPVYKEKDNKILKYSLLENKEWFNTIFKYYLLRDKEKDNKKI